MAKTKKETTNTKSSKLAFFPEAWQELKKIHTPTRQETVQGTIGVLLMVMFFGLFLGLGDLLVGKLMQAILT